ncbi:hypothetical protein BT93_I0323 [Corymbia citriodora subsp. variegata]|nr:hypothetical protein BT93_I0323 [Corymbia citriodora subsp. variegata]KAF8012157.1 hypothetical protein BT93_I0323 [Corymbia citriodora subsp. variegata]
MEYPLGGHAPAVLQLQKWSPPPVELNLSEFREAFISPTRQLLLLLSYQCEAALLPLLRGNLNIINNSECCGDGTSQDHSSSPSTDHDRLNLGNNLPSTSGPATECDAEFSCHSSFPGDRSYPFISDVTSMAWGACGDTYTHHQDTPFKEFLFVSGRRGVTVHAFRQHDNSGERTKFMPESKFGEGRWMEWGPCASTARTTEPSSSSLEVSGDCTEGIEEMTGNHKGSGKDESSSNMLSKKWLRSFFTRVETVEFDGKIWIQFPSGLSYPYSAEVVSFTIFDNKFSSPNAVSNGHYVGDSKDIQPESVLDPLDDASVNGSPNFQSDRLSSFLGVGLDCRYSCSKVFSSNSHYLIGLVLTSEDHSSISSSDANERLGSSTYIVVLRVATLGIECVSSVKLGEHLALDLPGVWTDFCFSDSLVVCLAASGFICFYVAISGEYVRSLDIMQACGVSSQLNSFQQENTHLGSKPQIKPVEAFEVMTCQSSHLNVKRKFTRLVATSYTSLLAAIDENGVTYVVSAANFLPAEYYSSARLPPHIHELGILVGWEVGGFDIGHSLVYPSVSRMQHRNDGSKELQKYQNWYLSGMRSQQDSSLSGSATSMITYESSHSLSLKSKCRRSVFLPMDGFKADDCICLSPLGITRLTKKHMSKQDGCQIMHCNLQVDFVVCNDQCMNTKTKPFNLQASEGGFFGEAVGCTFQGCLYLVTQQGLSVVLPSTSVSPNRLPKSIGYKFRSKNGGTLDEAGNRLGIEERYRLWSPWKLDVLDRVILYEGPRVADCLCLENGWDLKVSRIRQLQLALDNLKFDELERSLDMLVGVDLSEAGILRMIFQAAFLMYGKVGCDTDAAVASKLLALASSFATKLIRTYGLPQQKKHVCMLEGCDSEVLPPSPLVEKVQSEIKKLKRLNDMAYFLEIIRNLQGQLAAKFQRPGQGLVDVGDALSLVDAELSTDESGLSVVPANSISLGASHNHDVSLPVAVLGFQNNESLTLTLGSLDSGVLTNLDDTHDTSSIVPQVVEGEIPRRNLLPLENPNEMVRRWKMDNLDLKTVVRDALFSGRLPLAVLQLHLHQSIDLIGENEHHDTFNEVREVGRAIAYDLFLKGETRLAVATLQRLGEDIKTCLKELLFGTMRRSLRVQIAEEMERCGYLRGNELKILETIALIERLYPSSCFWKTYLGRRDQMESAVEQINMQLLLSPMFTNITIECGEIDGAVIGSWVNVSGNSLDPVVNEENVHGGYWAAAAVWSSIWDQKTIDRIVLDQPFVMGVHCLWDSQLEYHISHNEWEEVARLLDLMPSSAVCDGRLQISSRLQPSTTDGYSKQVSYHVDDLFCPDEIDDPCISVPGVKIFRFSADMMCSMWVKMLLEPELARRFIFLREYWEDTCNIVSLLACSSFITRKYHSPLESGSYEIPSNVNAFNARETSLTDSIQNLHKVIARYCAQYSLPDFLDLYLDHHMLGLDSESLDPLLEAVGDCEWARWLLFARVKGREYEASFSNSRAIVTPSLSPGSNLNVLEMHSVIRTVDEIAEGGGELAAVATLMYAPIPIQDCLSTGSVKRQSTSSQCTLENLRPILQRFPTLWRTLVGACLGQDVNCNIPGSKVRNALSEYLSWREHIFFSTGRDTSLIQMLPCWFPKVVRRLVQLYIQGPLGWQSLTMPSSSEYLLHRDDLFINGNELAQVSAISWEATIEKHIKEELYDSSLKETGLGLEHHLHCGRPLAAFNHLLGVRVQKLNLERQSGGPANVQSDIQTLLGPVTQDEELLLASVTPLAIMHFEDPMLVASCAFCLELCGLSASMLRVDVAALRRISSFYKSSQNYENYRQLSPKGSAFHVTPQGADLTESLARALADDYLHNDCASITKRKGVADLVNGKRPSRPLMLILKHLEKASLPLMADGRTCGSWLRSGEGDGADLRSEQKAASQHWNLVTAFCHLHQLPLSTRYLALLARDNDWVGFLSEAQVGAYPFDVVVQVASKEFSDPRLKLHILTVMKNMQSRKKAALSSHSDTEEKGSGNSCSDENVCIPVELFRILADCEKQKKPGEALLVKAKELSWSILATIASCFPDVTPFSCLRVWLEITAARETSLVKVSNMTSHIASNVAAAVKASNSQPTEDRALTFHYNRSNPKRRRVMEPAPLEISAPVGESSNAFSKEMTFIDHGISPVGEREGEVVTDKVSSICDEGPNSLSKMVAMLCEQGLFLPLLRAFEMFLPSCSLLPFIRALQAFSQMRLSEASAHLGSFSTRVKEEPTTLQTTMKKEENVTSSWISSTAVTAANAVLSICPSPYERRCLLQLLTSTDFGDGGSAAVHYRRLYWKINLAEPLLRKDDVLQLGNETLDDASLLAALEKNGYWDQARNWARQLDASGGPWKSSLHHVTETQAESMVAEWKEFLWDVPEERLALWGHCQTLFIRHSFPPFQAGSFFLKHAETLEKDLPAKELHELLLLSLQWLSGMMTLSHPVYPLHLIREIETRVWLLAVESEAQVKSEGESSPFSPSHNSGMDGPGMVDRTASIIAKMDNHMNNMRSRTVEKQDTKEGGGSNLKHQGLDSGLSNFAGGAAKTKRRPKSSAQFKRAVVDAMDNMVDSEDGISNLNARNDLQLQDENSKMELPFSRWEERVGQEELERAVLMLLEFGQISAAKQLQHKLSPGHVPSEFLLVDTALKLAAVSTPCSELPVYMIDDEVISVIRSYGILADQQYLNPLQVLESLTTIFTEDRGRGLCRRIVAVVKSANVLGLSFSEAFEKQPIEVLQLLSIKAQESFEEAKLLVQTHFMPAASIAQILAESFLKGLLAAHRGGYMESQKEEGPSPLLWRFSDFLTWAKLCPSEPEIGHALMRLVITGQEIPHACEVELLILSHHFYKSSACLDGVDVLVALAATRVDSYVSEGDFSCLARLMTGVKNFHALNFILGILIENGQLDLLLQKFSAAIEASSGPVAADNAKVIRGFIMAVLTSLKQFNPNDVDAFAMVYNHFDMRHETAALLEARAEQSSQLWFQRHDKDQNEDLLDSMRYFIEAAEVLSTVDAGNKTFRACAWACLVSLQIRMPDFQWLNCNPTNARYALAEQSRFQEALIVAEAYGLNHPSEWAPVLWNKMLRPELTEEFVAEFVAVLPLHPSMLNEIARYFRTEMAARVDQTQFSIWISGGGLPAEWAKYLARSFRCLLRRTRDLRLRVQMATTATGFGDVIDACTKAMDKVPENAGPLVLRRGHGGAYLPLM